MGGLDCPSRCGWQIECQGQDGELHSEPFGKCGSQMNDIRMVELRHYGVSLDREVARRLSQLSWLVDI